MKKVANSSLRALHKRITRIARLFACFIILLNLLGLPQVYLLGFCGASFGEDKDPIRRLELQTNPKLQPKSKRTKNIQKKTYYKTDYLNSRRHKDVLMRTARLRMGGRFDRINLTAALV